MASEDPSDGLPLGLDWSLRTYRDGSGFHGGYRPARSIEKYWWPVLFVVMVVVVRSGVSPEDPYLTRYTDFGLGMLAAYLYWFVRWSAAEEVFRHVLDIARASRVRLDASQAADLKPDEIGELRAVARDLGALAARIQEIEKRLDYDHSDYEAGYVHRTSMRTDLERCLADTRKTIERAAVALDMPEPVAIG